MAPDGPSARLPAGLSRPLWRRLLFGPARLRAGWRVLLFILLVMGIGALVRLAYDRLGIRLGRDWTPITFLVQEPLNLWFATGFHFAFDFAALSLFGAPNTGNQRRPVSGHLLDGTFSGPDWLTGGVRGVEASGLVFIVIAAMFGLFHLAR